MSIYTTLKGKLHSSLNNSFWLQLLEGIAEELELQKATKKEKITLNDLDSMNENDLFNLAYKYGYTPNLILNNSLEFLRKEVKSIPFRIQNKTTIKGMKLSFSQAEGASGEIYNVTYDTSKLARLVNASDSIENATSYIDGEPFLGIEPEIIFFSTIAEGLYYLDEGHILDESVPWTLDRSGLITTSKHITLEYFFNRIIVDNSIDYAITSDYISFLLSEADYNKRITNIPHVGIQINSVLPLTTTFNSESGDSLYTIPELKLQSALKITSFDLTNFQYFVAGIGKKGLPSEDFLTIFDNAQLHLSFSDKEEDTVEDFTATYTTAISGTEKRTRGIIGRSLNYKTDTYLTVSSFNIPVGDWTFNFWFKITNELVGVFDKTRYLISHPSINLSFIEGSTSLELNMFDGTTTFTEELTDGFLGQEIFGQIEFDSSNDLVNIYFNNILQSSLDVSGNLGFDATSNLILGSLESDPTNSDYMLNGIIDEFSFHNKVFPTIEKDFLFDTQYGETSYLGNVVFRAPMTSTEKSERVFTDTYYLLHNFAKANTTNDEIIYTSDGIEETFNTNLRYFPIEKGSVKLTYEYSDSSLLTITDDRNGTLTGDYASGTIDYTTGEIDLNYYIDFEQDNIVYSSVGGITDIDTILETVVLEASFTITYVIGGVTYTAEDNSLGAILGTHISTGTIDYNTGVVDISLDTVNDLDTPIRYSYVYRVSYLPINGKDVLAEYQTSNNLELTECGFEDIDGKLIQYTNFPKCQFGTPNAFLANNTIIKMV